MAGSIGTAVGYPRAEQTIPAALKCQPTEQKKGGLIEQKDSFFAVVD